MTCILVAVAISNLQLSNAQAFFVKMEDLFYSSIMLNYISFVTSICSQKLSWLSLIGNRTLCHLIGSVITH